MTDDTHLIELEHGASASIDELCVADLLFDVLTLMSVGRLMYRENDWGTLIRSFETH